jgi:hypothetical protein
MLGMFHLLPLLKGWEYKVHDLSRTVARGAMPQELSISETGWLIGIALISDDCYGTLYIDWQGADLQTLSWTWNAEIGRLLGSFAQDPGGWVQRYFRPAPNSTLGIYISVVFSGGYQGSTFPYVPTVKLKLALTNDSTQASASVRTVATVIAITDKKLFIQSLRRVLDANASLEIDKALEVIGPALFEEEKK